jgi:hypothetical protein
VAALADRPRAVGDLSLYDERGPTRSSISIASVRTFLPDSQREVVLAPK